MARILTGVQSTGVPHLGNLLGAIEPAIAMANDPKNESFLFIADMHSLTQIKDGEELSENTYGVAATWLAMGLDVDKTVFTQKAMIEARVPRIINAKDRTQKLNEIQVLVNQDIFDNLINTLGIYEIFLKPFYKR